jgi:histidine triad (HIT) family protein
MTAVDGDCLFCRIVAGEIPSDVVEDSQQTYAFRDINPGAPVHVLVVPRRHVKDAASLRPEDGDLLAEMVTTAQRVAEHEGIAGSGYRLVFNVGRDSLNEIPHLHLHVLGGRRLGWPPG